MIHLKLLCNMCVIHALHLPRERQKGEQQCNRRQQTIESQLFTERFIQLIWSLSGEAVLYMIVSPSLKGKMFESSHYLHDVLLKVWLCCVVWHKHRRSNYKQGSSGGITQHFQSSGISKVKKKNQIKTGQLDMANRDLVFFSSSQV